VTNYSLARLTGGKIDLSVLPADLTDGGDSTLHYHAADRNRGTHTGTQAASTITGLAAVATSGAKADVGLGNVDNTADSAKPVSTAQATRFITGPAPVALTDAATIATNAALANLFRVTITANRTLGAPTNPTDGQIVRWAVAASGTGPWTLTLATGAAGSFKFGTTITSVPAITTGTTTYVTAVYSTTAARWHVIDVVSGL
jgi:hypothetical protein